MMSAALFLYAVCTMCVRLLVREEDYEEIYRQYGIETQYARIKRWVRELFNTKTK